MARAWSLIVLLVAAMASAPAAPAVQDAAPNTRNKPERLEWFRDLGFGLFIHWNVDGVLGGVISHSLVGASEDYTRRYFELLPTTFDPYKFRPRDWAVLAKLAGMRYVVFTAKHHAGFCMYQTATTDFNVMNTPYGKDVMAEIIQAFRDEGLAIGLYFSPDDFHYLYTHGKPIARKPHAGVSPQEDEGLMRHDQAQLRELLTRSGPIDIVFLDGPAEGLRDLCWDVQPNVVVTRGAIETPEQYVPGVPLDGPWEANLTMGTEWPYKPTHESYKSGSELIQILIQTRAKGGNLLLNVGPKPDGELPIEQEERLREVALWSFVNAESIHDVRPWVITNEGSTWFTRREREDTLYAFVTDEWKYGQPKVLTLKSIQAGPDTRVSVLGQSGEILEYQPEVRPQASWEQAADGFRVTAWKAQRLYTDKRWPNPVVLKISHVRPGIVPPRVTTLGATWDASTRTASLEANLDDLGKVASVEVCFQYRIRKEVTEFEERPWQEARCEVRRAPGPYNVRVVDLTPGPYEYRAMVKHPLITMFGREKVLKISGP